jgi:predicted DNA-binding protein with PD1-like motif
VIYTSAKIGRTFVVRFENNDDFIKELENLVKKERIKTGFFVFLGGMRKGSIVCGPKKPITPPDPNWVSFKDAWEVFGTGSVFEGDGGPQIHIHTSAGKASKTLTGCLRKNAEVFITVEAFLMELKGIKARKEIDEKTGINMLKFM